MLYITIAALGRLIIASTLKLPLPFPGKYPDIVILFKVVFQHLPPLRAYIPPVVRRVQHLLYMAGAAAPVCQPQIIGVSVAACDPRHSSGRFKQCPARHNAAAQHIEAILCHPVHAWLEQRIAPLPLLQPVFVAKYQIIALGIFCEGIQRVRAENIARPHIHDKVELVRLRAFGDYPPAVGLFLYGVLGEPPQFIPALSRYGYGYHGHSAEKGARLRCAASCSSVGEFSMTYSSYLSSTRQTPPGF